MVDSLLYPEKGSVPDSRYSVNSEGDVSSMFEFKKQYDYEVFYFVVTLALGNLFHIFIRQVNLLNFFDYEISVQLLVFFIIDFFAIVHQEKGLKKIYQVSVFNYLLIIRNSLQVHFLKHLLDSS